MADTFKKFFETDVTFSQLQGQGEVTLASTNASTTAVLKQVVTAGGNAAMGTPQLMLDDVPVANLNVGGQVSGNQIVPESTNIKIKGGSDMGVKGVGIVLGMGNNYYDNDKFRTFNINADSLLNETLGYNNLSPTIKSYTLSEMYHLSNETFVVIDRNTTNSLYIYIYNSSSTILLNFISPQSSGDWRGNDFTDAVFDGKQYVYIPLDNNIVRIDCINLSTKIIYTHTQSFTDNYNSQLRVTLAQGMGQTPYLVTHLNGSGSDYVHIFNLQTNTLETASENGGNGISVPTSFGNVFQNETLLGGLTLSSGNILIHARTASTYSHSESQNSQYLEINPSTLSATTALFSNSGAPSNLNGVVYNYVFGGYSFFTDTDGNAYAYMVCQYQYDSFGYQYIVPFDQATKTLNFNQGTQIAAFATSLNTSSYGRYYNVAAFNLTDNTANPIKVAGYGIEST